MKTVFLIPLLASALLAPALPFSHAWADGAGITYHGRLIDPSGEAVVGSNVQFKIQLRTPGNENCLLYEEVQSKDLSQTEGIFSLTINDGSGTRLDSSSYNLDQIFANRGSFNFSSGQCATGTSYNPNPTDGRKIQVLFNDGTFAAGTWEAAPSVAINFIPMAIESMQIGGYKPGQLLKIADGVSTTGTELNNASWAELLALIGGTSTQYAKTSGTVFTAAPQWAGVPSAGNDLVNKTYLDSQIAAGLPDIGTAGTYAKVTTDAKGRVTAGSSLSESDIPTLSTAGKVSGASINAGTIAGSASINSTGNLVTTGTVQGAVVGGTNLRAYSGANYVQLSAPGGLNGNLNFALPASDGASGTLLKTNGSGQLSFTALGATDIPALDTGKLTTGTLPVTRGGTGTATLGISSVLVSNATGSAINSLNCTSGEVIKFDALGSAGCGTDTTGTGSQWTTSSSDIYYTTGKVGIGTATPSAALEVAGNITLSSGGTIKPRNSTGPTNGYDIYIQSGGVTGGVANGGNLNLIGGPGVSTGSGGNINITSGMGGPTGSSGALTLAVSDANKPAGVGSLNILGGNNSNGIGGAVNITGGQGSFGGGGGPIAITGGAAGYSGNANGGDVLIKGGLPVGTGTNGNVILNSSAGNVGIGTSNPLNRLTLGSVTDSATPGLLSQSDYSSTVSRGRFIMNTPTNYIGMGTLANGSLFLGTTVDTGAAISTPFVVTQGGNVGIGTTSPGAKLQIDSPSSLATFKVTGGVDATPIGSKITLGANPSVQKGINFNYTNSGGSDIFWMDGENGGTQPAFFYTKASVPGKVGIGYFTNIYGTNVDSALTIQSKTSSSADWAFDIFNSSNTKIFAVRADGNVGIGTTSPQTTLQVEGIISPATNNTYSLGNATYRFTEVYATNGVINTSDRREKNHIANTDLGLDFVNKLRPVSYRWNTGVDSEVHYGLIAQEAEQVLADLGKKEETSIVTHDAATDRYGVRYSELISPLIKAVQELYQNLMGVQSRQGALAREIASVKDRVEVENARKDEEIEKLKQANAAQAKEMAELKTYLCRHEKSAPFCK